MKKPRAQFRGPIARGKNSHVLCAWQAAQHNDVGESIGKYLQSTPISIRVSIATASQGETQPQSKVGPGSGSRGRSEGSASNLSGPAMAPDPPSSRRQIMCAGEPRCPGYLCNLVPHGSYVTWTKSAELDRGRLRRDKRCGRRLGQRGGVLNEGPPVADAIDGDSSGMTSGELDGTYVECTMC